MAPLAFKIIKQSNDRGKVTFFTPKIWKYFVENSSQNKIGYTII